MTSFDQNRSKNQINSEELLLRFLLIETADHMIQEQKYGPKESQILIKTT